MKFYIMTLFPEIFELYLNSSILGRAKKNNLIEIETLNIRDYTNDKHKKIDDYPYGGGAGMLMQCEPIYNTYIEVQKRIGKYKEFKNKILYLSPQGKVFNQNLSREYAGYDNIILLCGRYEGVDERVLELIDAEPVSIGDYVLTGGELAAMVVIDSVSRMVDGVLGNESSIVNESFGDGLLEHPQYTRPAEFMGRKVPEILLSGHEKNINEYNRRESIRRTFIRRRDLLDKVKLSDKEKKFIEELKDDNNI